MDIRHLDMHYRDEKVLEWLAVNNRRSVKAREVADFIQCHPNTARSILKRLKRAQLIELEGCKRGGYRLSICNVKSA